MKPTTELGRAKTPDGAELRLSERDGEYLLLLDGVSLMSSRMHSSEDALAELGCKGLKGKKQPHVLIGGLGMGYTLRAALDLLPSGGIVTVAELMPAVVEWNRGPLAPLAGRPLDDPRVRIEITDVGAFIRASQGLFDAILLDVDNGPAVFSAEGNEELYDDAGVAAARRALRPGGALAVWSAFEDRKFVQRLQKHGFQARAEHVRAHAGKGSRHTIFLGLKHDSPPARIFSKQRRA